MVKNQWCTYMLFSKIKTMTFSPLYPWKITGCLPPQTMSNRCLRFSSSLERIKKLQRFKSYFIVNNISIILYILL